MLLKVSKKKNENLKTLSKNFDKHLANICRKFSEYFQKI